MTPILNGNLSIHAIHLKLKKDPFPSKLCSHIPSKMDPSRPPGMQQHDCILTEQPGPPGGPLFSDIFIQYTTHVWMM